MTLNQLPQPLSVLVSTPDRAKRKNQPEGTSPCASTSTNIDSSIYTTEKN